MKNFEIPLRIFIITRSLNKKVKFGGHEIIFKTISGKEQGKKINIFSKLFPYTLLKTVEGYSFRISSLELALVETACVSGPEY